MGFWIAILACMVVGNLVTLGIAALMWRWFEARKQMLAKIERGNAAFEHLLNAQRQPPTAPVPFPKKAE